MRVETPERCADCDVVESVEVEDAVQRSTRASGAKSPRYTTWLQFLSSLRRRSRAQIGELLAVVRRQ